MRIPVSLKEISQAPRRSLVAKEDRWALAFRCPVALALWRHTGRMWSVCSEFADVPDSRRRAGHVFVRFAPGVTAWIKAFDRGEPVRPIVITIDYDAKNPTITPWAAGEETSE